MQTAQYNNNPYILESARCIAALFYCLIISRHPVRQETEIWNTFLVMKTKIYHLHLSEHGFLPPVKRKSGIIRW